MRESAWCALVALLLQTGCDLKFLVGTLDLGADVATDASAGRDLGVPCQSPSDCQLYGNNVSVCRAIAANDTCTPGPLPIDPCQNKHAACVSNICVVQ